MEIRDADIAYYNRQSQYVIKGANRFNSDLIFSQTEDHLIPNLP